MPLKINTLPNKSIHPGSTGSAGSRAVQAGAGERGVHGPWDSEGWGEGGGTSLHSKLR